MRKEFLRNIEGPPKLERQQTGEVPGYRELAKTALDNADSIVADLDKRIAIAALARATSKETQRTVFDLQVKKQEIMLELKEQLRQLDDPHHIDIKPLKSRTILYKDGEYIRPGKHDTRVTLGEIMTGAEWGIIFHLDPRTVPREVRKRFIVENAKRRIRTLLNDQITAEESTSSKTHEWKRDTYRLRAEAEQSSEVRHAGLLAEKMVKNLLTRLTYDFAVDFILIEADVHQDIEHKIDFIVSVQQRQRGVGVNKSQPTVRGIQFTINTAPEVLEKKRTQINRARREADNSIRDIVLVQIPLNDVRRVYDE